MKKIVLAAAALVAAVAVFVVLTVAPRRLTLQPFADGALPGILHIHSNRSDGLSGPDEIAAAAARAGLKFIVFTDHGDATRRPDPPEYRLGVLCIDGVEISTTGGHYVAIDMPPSPYPLGGEPRDVVEDVHRLGGFGIVAHPDSPKPQLRWADWNVPFDGVETVNLDTSWRVWARQANAPASAPPATASTRWSARRRLFAALVDYPFRPPETIASLIQTGGLIEQWTALALHRPVITVAGADAHAKLGLRADPADSNYVLPFPSYESSFRTLSVHVTPDRPLSGNATADGAAIVRAIRAGHVWTAIDAIAAPPSLEFTAMNRHGTAHAGDTLIAGGPLTVHVRSNAPSAFTTVVKNGAAVLGGDHHEQDFTVVAPDSPGVFWVEIGSSGRTPPVAWLTSNPVYVRASAGPSPVTPGRPSVSTQVLFDGKSTSGWRVEHDATSLAAVDPAGVVGGAELRFRFGLAGGSLAGQVAALVVDTPGGVAAGDRLAFTIRAEQPMRVSVQLRAADVETQRWQRSVYVDTIDQERTVYFDDLMPVGQTRSRKPALQTVRSLMFVVDTTNTKPGASGRFWIKRAELQK